jgi:proteasome assembly chaperone (PAC2) family protein
MIKRVDVRYLKDPKEVNLRDPILIEGLPGIGHVGKLVADHLVKELKAEKVVEIYSHHFPPQVMVLEQYECPETRSMPGNRKTNHQTC